MYENILNKVPSKYMNLWYQAGEHDYRIMTITDGVVKVNDMGAYIWSLIDGKKSVQEMIQLISSQFDTAYYNRIANDVCNFIEQFIKMEVVTLDWLNYLEEFV